MFGPHDSLSTARGLRFIAVRSVVLAGPVFVAIAAAPMLLMLLPVAFAGLPFLLFAFLSGASGTRYETKRIETWRGVPQHA
jgi:hypothetical protein